MTTSDAPGSLGETIRRRRIELGWSQEHLAAQASGGGDEVRQSDISRLECGRVGLPRRARLQRIAAALGLTPGDLLARSGWAGADLSSVAAPAEPENRPAPPAPTARPSPAAEPWARGDDAGRLAQRLRRVIDDAEQTRARSAQILRRADEVYALVATPCGRAPRPDSTPGAAPACPPIDAEDHGGAAPETGCRAPSDR